MIKRVQLKSYVINLIIQQIIRNFSTIVSLTHVSLLNTLGLYVAAFVRDSLVHGNANLLRLFLVRLSVAALLTRRGATTIVIEGLIVVHGDIFAVLDAERSLLADVYVSVIVSHYLLTGWFTVHFGGDSAFRGHWFQQWHLAHVLLTPDAGALSSDDLRHLKFTVVSLLVTRVNLLRHVRLEFLKAHVLADEATILLTALLLLHEPSENFLVCICTALLVCNIVAVR